MRGGTHLLAPKTTMFSRGMEWCLHEHAKFMNKSIWPSLVTCATSQERERGKAHHVAIATHSTQH